MSDTQKTEQKEYTNIIAALEALLFQYGEPLHVKKVAKFLSLSEEKCNEIISEYGKILNEENRGLTLQVHNEKIQLVTKPEFYSVGEKIIQEEFKEQLTPAAVDTLSIIAYLGPVSRPSIDFIRGVNSSFTLRNLLVRGLIEREQGKEKGHLFEYRVSFNFLNHMGISSVNELPEYEKYKDILKKFESQVDESDVASTVNNEKEIKTNETFE